jgi:hypothetical protein
MVFVAFSNNYSLLVSLARDTSTIKLLPDPQVDPTKT